MWHKFCTKLIFTFMKLIIPLWLNFIHAISGLWIIDDRCQISFRAYKEQPQPSPIHFFLLIKHQNSMKPLFVKKMMKLPSHTHTLRGRDTANNRNSTCFNLWTKRFVKNAMITQLCTIFAFLSFPWLKCSARSNKWHVVVVLVSFILLRGYQLQFANIHIHIFTPFAHRFKYKYCDTVQSAKKPVIEHTQTSTICNMDFCVSCVVAIVIVDVVVIVRTCFCYILK